MPAAGSIQAGIQRHSFVIPDIDSGRHRTSLTVQDGNREVGLPHTRIGARRHVLIGGNRGIVSRIGHPFGPEVHQFVWCEKEETDRA